LGWREDAADLLATCDVFVCPSRHEPLGNVVIEAWAQGKPVIAADSLGPGTLIEHMETGILVPVDDAPTMARAIRYVVEDENVRARIATQGHEVFLENFTEETIVSQYMTFFEERLSG
ncbi:MAG: glycosyltransferase family 4 protein, partial [Roseovarius confluentis]